MTRGIALLALVTLLLVAVQISIVSPLRVAGVVVMVVWLWPLALGLTSSTGVAVAAGFVTGLLFDAHTITPFGLTALVGAALAWIMSLLAREGVGDLDGSAWWVPAILVAVGGLAAPLMFVVGGVVTGHLSLWHASVLPMMLLNFVTFFLLARPLARLAQWIAATGGWTRA